MRNGKYMDDYNYHDWSKFMVRTPAEKPKGPHFAAVLFTERSEFMPAFDQFDRDTYTKIPEITYFAFPDQETLGEWALRATKGQKQFFCFEVKKLGSVELKVSVDIKDMG